MKNKSVAALVLAAMAAPAAGESRLPQAEANYRAVLNGSRQIVDLSAQELADIDELDRRLRAQKPDIRTASQRCVDGEVKRAGGQVSQLGRRVIDMKCREAGD